KGMLTAGLGGGAFEMFAVRQWVPARPVGADANAQSKWVTIEAKGDRRNIKAAARYKVRATLSGSNVTLHVNDVLVITARIPSLLGKGRTTGFGGLHLH